jgi:hypothetical protein
MSQEYESELEEGEIREFRPIQTFPTLPPSPEPQPTPAASPQPIPESDLQEEIRQSSGLCGCSCSNRARTSRKSWMEYLTTLF